MFKKLKEETQSDVLIVPYRGYSKNEGKPSQQGLKKDADAIIEYALTYR